MHEETPTRTSAVIMCQWPSSSVGTIFKLTHFSVIRSRISRDQSIFLRAVSQKRKHTWLQFWCLKVKEVRWLGSKWQTGFQQRGMQLPSLALHQQSKLQNVCYAHPNLPERTFKGWATWHPDLKCAFDLLLTGWQSVDCPRSVSAAGFCEKKTQQQKTQPPD